MQLTQSPDPTRLGTGAGLAGTQDDEPRRYANIEDGNWVAAVAGAPVITSLDFDETMAGSTRTLTEVYGSDFAPDAQIFLDGINMYTVFADSGRLQMLFNW